MSQLDNCPNCGEIYVQNAFRDVCEACYREEEGKFQSVYAFLRQRANRMATMEQVVSGTDVSESLITKFIRKGRIQLSQLPNLGYPCDRCGTIIREDRLCLPCKKDIKGQLSELDREEERKKMKNQVKTYHSVYKKF
ncbi:hypothetical protein FIU87_18570 [Bacillus sp. THAF10]|uniref:TIGR03826 family flagellar region protein n=1 Tax=Bacillus sp. THAF10 TaxID=2587848 RepID=UPI0012690817|nr:TIGR03826 family flagellar region protein [Bacillus sp. THAF10]QFT90652.1 hypothetical protein FIU87_18570 [Bacillus sp. THAF10]